MRSLTSYRAEQEYERLRSRVATLEYEVARLRERLDEVERFTTDDHMFIHHQEDR